MAEKEPEPSPAKKKGILKLTRQPSESSSKAEDGIKWDEMNILATYHPPGKDYGHMKIDEPDTPYNRYQDPDNEDEDPQSDTEAGTGSLNPSDIANRLEKDTLQKRWWEQEDAGEEGSDDEDDNVELTEEEKAKKLQFETKRKQHYNEAMFMKRAKQLIAEEFDEDEDEEEGTEEAKDSATETKDREH